MTTTITVKYNDIEYVTHKATHGCDGCVFAHGNECTAPIFAYDYDCAGDFGSVIWLRKNPECCGQPNTCEQPCFHASGRTTPGQPGMVASVPESQSSGASVADAPPTSEPQYDPRDVSFNPLDRQVGGNHYRDNSAPGFLREAISVMEQRGQQYDTEGGERSFEAAADTFNAITGYEITAADVALVQVCIKLVRSQSREEPHRDSLLDAVAYMALHGEERMKEGA